LHLEVTEGSVVEATEYVLDNIEHLCVLGVPIALDDFGTGYSSLSYLRKLPIQTLKIDRSFISGEESQDNRLIVEAVVRMAKALNLRLICEGIETEEQARWLQELGCDLGQGYWYSRPLAVGAMTKLLQQRVVRA
jgi:EAL domain-containing protein (putative c-di-GMP-specific phosphodiesterase class I)